MNIGLGDDKTSWPITQLQITDQYTSIFILNSAGHEI